MKKFILSIAAMTLCQSAAAVSEGSKLKTKAKKAPTKTILPWREMSLDFVMWQESIPAKNTKGPGHMRMLLQGIQGGYYQQLPFQRTKARWFYGGEAAGGIAKGKGSGEIPDELKSQPWAMATFRPGLMYRTTPVSEIGISSPISVRQIQWALKTGSDLRMERQTSFSAGLTGTYTNRFSRWSSLNISVTHEVMWEATIWMAGWTYIL